MTREKYEHYVQLFNARDPRYAEYYDPDVVFDARPAPQPLHGRQAILDMYDGLWKQLDEEITIGRVVIDNEQGLMAAEITNRITVTQDDVKLPSRTMNKGDVSVGSGVIFYGLSNGRISVIREANSGRTFTPAGQ
jgi:ketosteroid isomerase-like protein